ncbi:SusC/RagA family TonB-linked outer membrane protein [Labilibaculum filiforme]|nr:SusC/RagA family TonB-linked outer membrane protein [Labilibaculum filiforme]
MKLTLMFLIIGILQVSANVYSQNGKLSIQVEKMELTDLFWELQENSDVVFIYKSKDLIGFDKVSITRNNASIQEILEEVLEGKDLEYSIDEDVVIIKKKRVEEENSAPIEGQQKKSIKGKVTDKNGTPLPGVSVYLKGTYNGVATNIDGEFSINGGAGDILVISSVGMETKEITIENQLDLKIVLMEQTSELDDVVVTGYFNKGKAGFAGTVTNFSQEDLVKVSTGNVLTTISALDPSFRIHESNLLGSDPNSVPDFTIRGRGSFLNSSTQPVFIVDGFQSTAEYVMDMDPNRIASINILKDASATILYGSRAANGVVVIETTKPEAGKLRVTYDFRPTFEFADLRDYNLMNATEKLEFEKMAGLYDSEYPQNQLYYDKQYNDKLKRVREGVDTYWLSKPLRNAVSQAHSLYVEGGSEDVRYAIDAKYTNQQGVMKGSGNEQIDFGFKLIYRIANKITIKNYAQFVYKDRENSPYGSFSNYTRLNPYERTRDENGDLMPILEGGALNPLYDASLPSRNTSNYHTFYERLNLDWNISEAFRFVAQANVMFQDNESEIYTSPFSSIYNGISEPEKKGSMTVSDGKVSEFSSNINLQYNKEIDNHTLFFVVGGEIMFDESDNRGFTVQGFPSDQYIDVAFAMQYPEGNKPISSSSISRSMGTFLNANYIYDNRFFIDGSLRYDGSSKFGADNKFALFWAAGAGWNLHNESFFTSDVINNLKLRYNYGVTGNQEFSAHQALTMYQYQTDRFYSNAAPAVLMAYGNPDLSWQDVKTHSLGLDFGFKENRIQGSINYYKKNTTGMLTDVTVAPSLGFPNGQYKANLGEIENKGYELNLNLIPYRNREKEMEVGLGIQIAKNENKVLKISEALKTINDENNENKFVPGSVYKEGRSISALMAVRSLGINPTTGEELYLKADGKTVTTVWDANDKVYIGDTEPEVFGNINTNFAYKRWNLNMVFDYSLGAKVYNSTVVDKVENLSPYDNGDKRALYDRWKEVGDLSMYKGISDAGTTYITDRFVQTENYLRLRSMTLMYKISNSEKLKKYNIQSLRLSFYANNLFRVSNIEVERGLSYPFARSFGFGVNVMF